MIAGRATTLLLSVVGLFLFPALLGPEAHGWLQYYLSLELFLLAFPNGCAAPIAAHYVALYRVSAPRREGVLLKQAIRWFIFLVALTSVFYFLLPDKRGFGWVFLAAGTSSCSQLFASALYGAGRLGGVTWFPVLNLLIRMALIGGFAAAQSAQTESGGLGEWGSATLPVLLFVATLPSWLWMARTFFDKTWRAAIPPAASLSKEESFFPWEEIRRFGLAALVGQILFQSYTRSLPLLAGQLGHPASEIGYLGVATQAFGQLLFIAGFVSVAVYPWLVSSSEGGDFDRFRDLQSTAWRLCVFLAGGMTAGAFALIEPAIRILLPAYREDADLFTLLVRIGVISGAVVLAGDFHLRMLVSLTRMREYLVALLSGFVAAAAVVVGVSFLGGGILHFSLALPVGGGVMTGVALGFAPRTVRFWSHNLFAAVGGILAFFAARPLVGDSIASMLLQGVVLAVVYLVWAGLVGLVKREDFLRFKAGRLER